MKWLRETPLDVYAIWAGLLLAGVGIVLCSYTLGMPQRRRPMTTEDRWETRAGLESVVKSTRVGNESIHGWFVEHEQAVEEKIATNPVLFEPKEIR